VQLRKHAFKFVDVDIQDAFEKLAANLIEARFQVRSGAFSPSGCLDDLQPVVRGVTPAAKEAMLLQPIDESRDFAFVPAHGFGQLACGGRAFFRAVQQQRSLLRRHSKLAEAPVKRGLQTIARPEEPRYG
jgi:hypothetical protein